MTYLGEVILITALSGMIHMLAPEGALKKHLQFVISLCMLAAIAVPMFSAVVELPELLEKSMEKAEMEGISAEKEANDTWITMSRLEIEKGTAAYIAEKYDIPKEKISVSVMLDATNSEAIAITAIEVKMRGISAAKGAEIKRVLEELFLEKSEITVLIEEEKS
jgi:hypothetical protein